MKERIRHRILIICILIIVVGGITLLLNNISFNPDFSVMDAISSATKKSSHDKGSEKVISKWKYTREDIELSDNDSYTESFIIIEDVTYKILENTYRKENAGKMTLLSNKEDTNYQAAVKKVAEYLENQGYDIQIKEYTESMMLSMAHAGKFTFFIMDEEVQQ